MIGKTNSQGVVPKGTINITENGTYSISSFSQAIVSVSGLVPSGTLEISSNGVYDVTTYANASVSVPSFEPSGTTSIYANGIYNIRDYASVDVQVPLSGPTIDDLLDDNISSITLGATQIPSYAFYGKSNLRTVNAPNVTFVGSSAFYYCRNINSISFPALKRINYWGFLGVTTPLSALPLDTIECVEGYACQNMPYSGVLSMPNVWSCAFNAFTTSSEHKLIGFDMPNLEYGWGSQWLSNWTISDVGYVNLPNAYYLQGVLSMVYVNLSYMNIGTRHLLYLQGLMYIMSYAKKIDEIHIGGGTQFSLAGMLSYVYGGAKITSVYINSVQPPITNNTNDLLFKYSVVSSIYVPRQCVTMYKRATNWTLASSFIHGYDTGAPLEVACMDVEYNVSCTVTIDCSIGDHLVLFAATRHSSTVTPSGWSLLYSTSFYYNASGKTYVYEKTAELSTETVTVSTPVNGRIYLQVCNIKDKIASVREDMCFASPSGGQASVCTILKATSNPVVINCTRTWVGGNAGYSGLRYNAFDYLGQEGAWDYYVATGSSYRTNLAYTTGAVGTVAYKTSIKALSYYASITCADNYGIVAVELLDSE